LSLSIAGAYCRSMTTTSIPGRLLRSNFSLSLSQTLSCLAVDRESDDDRAQ